VYDVPTWTMSDWMGLIYVVGFVLVIALIVSGREIPSGLKRVIYAGLALRIFGGLLRYWVFYEIYGASGDAPGYYTRGVDWSRRIYQGDFSPFYDRMLWFNGSWKETGFMGFPSMFVISLIGPSMVGEFVAFSMLAFLGITGFVMAFKKAYPDIPLTRYARWVFFFPSLWYWPSSVGKEAIMLMGIGLAVWGFIGKRINWVPLLIGGFFVWAVRPQVAAVLIFSLFLSYWLASAKRLTFGRVLQGAALIAVCVVGMRFATAAMGVQDFGLEGIQEYVEAEQLTTVVKGSSVQKVGLSPLGVPLAMINVLTRPWPWEARNGTALLSALELLMVWGIIWYRRKNFMRALKHWRSHAVLRLAVPFIVIYSVSLGLLVVNLGIIARQRVFLFPFLFFFLEAVPAVGRKRTRAPAPYGMPQPMPQSAPSPNVAVGPIR
jgi:hypothetical protein